MSDEAPGGTRPTIQAPGGIIYEPGERVLAVGRPFAWWVLLVGAELVLLIDRKSTRLNSSHG